MKKITLAIATLIMASSFGMSVARAEVTAEKSAQPAQPASAQPATGQVVEGKSLVVEKKEAKVTEGAGSKALAKPEAIKPEEKKAEKAIEKTTEKTEEKKSEVIK